MIMAFEPIYNAYKSIINKENTKVIYLSPKGKTLNQKMVKTLSKEEHIILICGHYEGIDERIIEEIVDEEISIGDYILTGGEIPAMVIVDSVSRYVSGVIKQDSVEEETFTNGLLEYPQYTRPEVVKGREVPKVLLSGHHQNIEKWRKEKSIEITYIRRPEFLKTYDLTKEDKQIIDKFKK